MRTLSYANFHRGNRVECETLVLMCVDFRFNKHLAELLGHAGYRDFDMIALPGASRAVNDQTTREVVFKSIELAVRLHKVKRVIIVDHEDCGSCGGSAAFQNTGAEEKFHVDSLKSAAGILRSRFSGLQIVAAYMDWHQIRMAE